MLAVLMGVALLGAVNGAHAGWNPFARDKEKSEEKVDDVTVAISDFRKADPDIARFFDRAYAYAVFPGIGKGGLGVGAAFGRGVVFAGGKRVARTSVKQVTIGFQLGGQKYSEIIFFEGRESFEAFKKGNYELSAQASAVALTKGAAKDVPYENGVAVFTVARGGLMYEASVGGQKFTYDALGD